MTKQDFFLLIDEICSLKPGTICGNESLADSEFIDSLAMLGIVAMLDNKFDLQIQPDNIKQLRSMNELYSQIPND